MSLLTRVEIEGLLNAPLDERLVVAPLLDPEHQIGPASIDLRLGTEFLQVRRLAQGEIDPLTEQHHELRRREERVVVPLGGHLSLHPGQFVLGSTLEFLRLPPGLGGQVLGRSSWGRLGLVVATAVVVQPDYAGMLTLELVNMGSVPVRLYPGLRIAQLMLWRTEGKASYREGRPKYDSPLGPESTRVVMEHGELQKLKRLGALLEGEQPALSSDSGQGGVVVL